MSNIQVNQEYTLHVEMNGKVYRFPVPADTPLGELHDVLMLMKGYTIERMLENQKQEVEISKKMQAEDPSAKEEPKIEDMKPDVAPLENSPKA